MIDFIASIPQFVLNILITMLASGLIAVVVFYVRRQLELVELANKTRTSINEITGNEFSTGDQIENVKEAIASLIEFAREKKPDQIVGVHTGGRLASVLVCEALGLSSHKCGFISTDINPGREPYLRPETNSLSGRLLIIDDVTRTGSTFEIIRRNIIRDTLSGVYSVISANFAVLLVAKERKRLEKGFFIPDWWAFTADNPDQALPWSSLSANIRAAHLLKRRNKAYDKKKIDLHDELVKNYEFSLYTVKLALDDNKRFDELVQSDELFLSWSSENAKLL
jgi:adenine/guanine phosphoribosyltransferase-like PRPP-binding protein